MALNLQEIEAIRSMILGYKKNGRPRALWDVVTKSVEIANGECKKDKNKGSKKKRKKKNHGESKSLQWYYEHAFDTKHIRW